MENFDFISFVTNFNKEYEKEYGDRTVKINFSQKFQPNLNLKGLESVMQLTIQSHKCPYHECVVLLNQSDNEVVVEHFSTLDIRKNQVKSRDVKTALLGVSYLFGLAEKLTEQQKVQKIHLTLDRLGYDYEFIFTRRFHLEKTGRKITMKLNDEDNWLRFKHIRMIDAMLDYSDYQGNDKNGTEFDISQVYSNRTNLYVYSYGGFFGEINVIQDSNNIFYLFESKLKYKLPLSKDTRVETVRNEVWQFFQGIEKRIRPYILFDSFRRDNADGKTAVQQTP